MNALLGIAKPGELGIDILHYNLHKTFSTPHGGGGPGSGPVSVVEKLVDLLPGPIVDTIGENQNGPIYGFVTPKHTIGRMKSFHGHFGVLVRAFTYILMHGASGLREVSEMAVLNANYLMHEIKKHYKLPYDRTCMHEFVVEGRWPDAQGIHALDVSKRLMDFGFHPPTNYFPLIVKEALMIEPTETENIETLDAFIEVMKQIKKEAHETPDLLHEAPHNTPIRRLDEVQAAKELVLCCQWPDQDE
jgi:glycine dehydrogenase subunit 2